MFDKNCEKTNVYDACAAWYKTPAGAYALQQLDNEVENYLSKIFGYYALEMGALVGRHHFLDKSRVSACFSLGHTSSHIGSDAQNGEQKIELTAEVDALPIDFDSVDLVLASHVLECACNPHQVLREIDRVLIPEGQCLFINFNALALWGGHRYFCNQADRTVKPYGLYRIRDWFSVLGWEVLDVSYVSFRSSYLKGKMFERLLKLEKWGSLYWPIFSNITIIHAKKRALIMPPAKQKRRKAGIIVPTNVAINPASRSSHYCESKKNNTHNTQPSQSAQYVEMFTDGACRGNPGGVGALLRYGKHEKELYGYQAHTTNNQMEMMAAIQALKTLKRPCKVVLTTDSNYLRQGITQWIHGWKKRNWQTASKQPVKNKELWQQLDQVVNQHDIQWKWVKGHSGHAENERADALANRAIDEKGGNT